MQITFTIRHTTTTTTTLQYLQRCIFSISTMNSFRNIFQKSNDDRKASLKHSKSMTYSQHPHYHGPTDANIDSCTDLLDKSSYSPEPTERVPRRGFRALSLNSKSFRPQVPVKQRLAERIRTKSNAGRLNIPPPSAPAPPLPNHRYLHRVLSRSAYKSLVNISEVASHVAVQTLAPAHPKYDEILQEQDPIVLRKVINDHPLSPVCSEHYPEHMHPMHFDMDEPQLGSSKTLQFYINTALAQGRPLDVRAGGRYRRIVDAHDPMDIVSETGSDWDERSGE
ncbi:uncharacterized protein EDB93DRAFT_211633 [Suillus bovinus]|uniref:uncharacterized protein n=1 Tax=Suillus bovinus TaxID=48563 RepID=UPI001B86F54F|nr:uncharacterized protein EDB93DRAFT_211633 [Suillus bovinus]KAG2153731.1 hypothetical protein EDB93DRAFT_211633 [Suillus bovinus]